MKIIDDVTTQKLLAAQAANAAKGKRTHPIGTYMLFGFIGLIVVASLSNNTAATKFTGPSNPGIQWAQTFGRTALDPYADKLGVASKECTRGELNPFTCKRLFADVVAANDSALIWMTSNPAPACIARPAQAMRDSLQTQNTAVRYAVQGINQLIAGDYDTSTMNHAALLLQKGDDQAIIAGKQLVDAARICADTEPLRPRPPTDVMDNSVMAQPVTSYATKGK